MHLALAAAIILTFWVLAAQEFEFYFWPPTYFEKNSGRKIFMKKLSAEKITNLKK